MSSGSVSNSGPVSFNQFSNDFDSQFTTMGMAQKKDGRVVGWLSHNFYPGYKSSLQKKVDTNKCNFMQEFKSHPGLDKEVTLSNLRVVANKLPKDFYERKHCGTFREGAPQKGHTHTKNVGDEFDKVIRQVKTFKEFKSAIRSGDGAKMKTMMIDSELMKFMISPPADGDTGTPLFQVSDEIKQPRELAKLVNVINQDKSISQADKDKAIQETIRGMLDSYGSNCVDEFYKNIDVDKTNDSSLKAILQVSLEKINDRDSKCKGFLSDRVLSSESSSPEAKRLALPFCSQEKFSAIAKSMKSDDFRSLLYPEGEEDPWQGRVAIKERRHESFQENLISKFSSSMTGEKLEKTLEEVKESIETIYGKSEATKMKQDFAEKLDEMYEKFSRRYFEESLGLNYKDGTLSDDVYDDLFVKIVASNVVSEGGIENLKKDIVALLKEIKSLSGADPIRSKELRYKLTTEIHKSYKRLKGIKKTEMNELMGLLHQLNHPEMKKTDSGAPKISVSTPVETNPLKRKRDEDPVIKKAVTDCLTTLRAGSIEVVEEAELNKILEKIKEHSKGDTKLYNALKQDVLGGVTKEFIIGKGGIDSDKAENLNQRLRMFLPSTSTNPIINQVVRGSGSIEAKQADIRKAVDDAIEKGSLDALVNGVTIQIMKPEHLEALLTQMVEKGSEDRHLQTIADKVASREISPVKLRLALPFCSQATFKKCIDSERKKPRPNLSKILFPQGNDCDWPNKMVIQERRLSKIADYFAPLVKVKLENPDSTEDIPKLFNQIFPEDNGACDQLASKIAAKLRGTNPDDIKRILGQGPSS